VLKTVELPGLDPPAIGQAVDRVLGDELYWFPVRHHSPTVARHLEAAIHERRPKLVLIEGPAECTPLVRFVVDAKTRPPIALYSSYRDDGNVLGLAGVASPSPSIPARFAVWYPLLAYSPEYVTMKAAAAVGATVELVDLPHAALIRPAPGPPPVPTAEPPTDAGTDEDSEEPPETEASSTALPGATGKPVWEPERVLVESGYYQALAETAGFRNWNQAWDSLFEFGLREADREEFRREMATFCAAARATAHPERMALDGTLERERFMWRSIQRAIREHGIPACEALVVTGGFHLFLDREDAAEPPVTPPGTVYTSVVPYSFFRVSELSGYGAGNRAPQFYQSFWELGPTGDVDDLLARHVVSVLKRARRERERVSSADAISVAQHARLLAALRRRAHPILDDIHDAIVTCCCKGSPESHGRGLARAIDAVDVGSKIGAVTPELGRLPLLADFYAQIDSLALGEVVDQEKRVTVKVDKREAQGRDRSAFLHRLRFLEVPICELAEAGGSGGMTGTIFREVWRLRWSPQIETELTERSLYGDTVEAASLARLREQLEKDLESAGRTSARLRDALDMGLPSLADEIERACGAAIVLDPRFVSLAECLQNLQLLRRHLAYQEHRRQALDDLVEQCFDRACFSLPEAANAPEAEQEAVVNGLRIAAEALLADDGERLGRDVLVQHVRSAVEASTVAFLRGAFLGMLAELRVVPPEDTSAALAAYAQEPVERMVAAGEFLDGMLASGRTSLLLGADHLVAAMDELLRAADHDAFLLMLPRLRSAFDRLHERQRSTLADRVARRYGLKEAEQLTRLSATVAATALVARLDEVASRVLAEWEL
jgi:hypothetical protein